MSVVQICDTFFDIYRSSLSNQGPLLLLFATVVVQDVARIRRAFETGNGAQVFVDGSELMVGHVVKRWPWHDLEKASVDGRRNAVCRGGSWRNVCTGRVDFIEINAGPHDLLEL